MDAVNARSETGDAAGVANEMNEVSGDDDESRW